MTEAATATPGVALCACCGHPTGRCRCTMVPFGPRLRQCLTHARSVWPDEPLRHEACLHADHLLDTLVSASHAARSRWAGGGWRGLAERARDLRRDLNRLLDALEQLGDTDEED